MTVAQCLDENCSPEALPRLRGSNDEICVQNNTHQVSRARISRNQSFGLFSGRNCKAVCSARCVASTASLWNFAWARTRGPWHSTGA